MQWIERDRDSIILCWNTAVRAFSFLKYHSIWKKCCCNKSYYQEFCKRASSFASKELWNQCCDIIRMFSVGHLVCFYQLPKKSARNFNINFKLQWTTTHSTFVVFRCFCLVVDCNKRIKHWKSIMKSNTQDEKGSTIKVVWAFLVRIVYSNWLRF